MKYHRDEEYLKNEALFENIFLKRYELIKYFTPKVGRVLEIGCSTGILLSFFTANGWETWGVEPSKIVNSAKCKVHRAIHDTFENTNLPKKHFDLVILNHTLEHMVDPIGILKKISSSLVKDGIIYVDVPNAGGISAKLLGKHWPFRLPKEHKHQFTRDSLSKIFKQTGFSVIYFESRAGLFEYANPYLELWQSLSGLKKRFFFDLLTLPYALCATLLNMGDSMTLIGRVVTL